MYEKITISRNRLATSESDSKPFGRNILGFHIADWHSITPLAGPQRDRKFSISE